jgi:hypothetical protein
MIMAEQHGDPEIRSFRSFTALANLQIGRIALGGMKAVSEKSTVRPSNTSMNG